MGNQLSCISNLSTAIAANAIRSSDIKPCMTILNVVNGRACQVEEPLTVGELMLEFPGQCVVEFGAQTRIDITLPSHIMEQRINVSGKKSRRIVALPADHELCAHHLYFLLPLQRIDTRLSADELQILVTVATTLARNSASAHMNTSKITPLSPCQCEEAASIRTAAASIPMEDALQGLSRVGKLLRGSEGKVQQEEEEIDNAAEPPLGRRTMIRTRSWTPKLDTIVESLPLH